MDHYSLDDFLFLYGKWIRQDNGIYRREVRKYKLDLSLDNVKELFNNPVDNILEFMGEPIASGYEESNNVNEEENVSYVSALIYDVDKNEFKIVREEVRDNVFCTTLYAVLSVLLFAVYFIWKDIDFIYEVKKIIDEYNLPDENYKKKLKY